MSDISNSATSSPGPLSFRCWRHGSHIWCPKTMKRQPPCWCSKVDFFFLCQGRNVTILTRAHTVLYGFKNFVQNSVFAFLNYITGSLCFGQIQASTSPRATPRAFDFFENYCSNSPLPGPKCRSNALHWGPFRWSNAPTPGTFHRHKNDRRMAETPSVVEQNLYKYNKNWETLLAYLLRTKVSCKAAEIAATRSLNAQLFFVMQHTKRSIKKDPTYWDYYIMTISLTCIIAHLIN